MFEYALETEIKLERYPLLTNDNFLAWDSADEYIINEVSNNYSNLSRVLIIEDDFGAISLGIQAEEIFLVNDSILSQKGIKHNLQINNKKVSNTTFISPYDSFPSDIDLIIIKIPKINKYLEFLLNKVNKTYNAKTKIILGARVKYLNSTIYSYCKLYLSDFCYSLSWKKSKIITASLKENVEKKDFVKHLAAYDLNLINYPNLFSSDKVDIGSSFLLDNLNKINFTDSINNIIDLGSANGILGLTIHKILPDSKLWLTDITYSALESAKASVESSYFDSNKVFFKIDNSLDSFEDNFADLIVINPPFHENHKVSIQTTLKIFEDCFRVMKKSAQLLIIANKHLGYHKHLKSYFSDISILDSNQKFYILTAVK